MSSHLPDGTRLAYGTATAAYQVEGSTTADGRGPSIWDTFTARPGTIKDRSDGSVACASYLRLDDDLELLAGLGVDFYRFSVAWPRVQPTGSGAIEPRGLAYYDRLVDGLLARGVQPMATLYHWDLPQPLEDAGGWPERTTAERFADYAAIVHDHLGDRVQIWATHNEPWCASYLGYAAGVHAPGLREPDSAHRAAHHLLLGHGLAVPALRAAGGESVGITLNLSPAVAATDAEADLAAAQRQDLMLNRLFTDPVLSGRYPDGAEELWGADSDFSFRHDDDLAVISAPLDFLGVNYYLRAYVRDAPRPEPGARSAYEIGVAKANPSDVDKTQLGWPIEPVGLYETLVTLRQRYPDLPPVYITENGCAWPDEAGMPDQRRIDFIESHLAALQRAMADGADVRGYFYWSLLDNFEWALGYDPRFGLVHVDYNTQVRTPKASYAWLRDSLRG